MCGDRRRLETKAAGAGRPLKAVSCRHGAERPGWAGPAKRTRTGWGWRRRSHPVRKSVLIYE